MTQREFFRLGGNRAGLRAIAYRRLPYRVFMFHYAIDCAIPDHKRMYFGFARRA